MLETCVSRTQAGETWGFAVRWSQMGTTTAFLNTHSCVCANHALTRYGCLGSELSGMTGVAELVQSISHCWAAAPAHVSLGERAETLLINYIEAATFSSASCAHSPVVSRSLWERAHNSPGSQLL